MGGMLSTGGATSWTFLNCTVEENAFASAAPAGIFQSIGSALALVNCAVRETRFTGAAGTLSDVRFTAANGTLSIINSAFANASEGYQPLSLNASYSPGLAHSIIAGFTPPAATGANGYVYDVLAAQPVFVKALQENAAGLRARRLAASSPALDGRKMWLKDGVVFFYDDVANAAMPWRKVIDQAFFAASVNGLDLDADCIPDAFGCSRAKGRVAIGPLNVQRGSTLLIR
jgi:hypothetical protein